MADLRTAYDLSYTRSTDIVYAHTRYVESAAIPPGILALKYSCVSGKCKFPLDDILNSVELLTLGVRDSTYTSACVIADDPVLFTAPRAKGVVFVKNQKPVLYLQNEGAAASPSIMATCDVSGIQKRMVEICATNATKGVSQPLFTDKLRSEQNDPIFATRDVARIAIGFFVGGVFRDLLALWSLRR